MFVDFYWDIAIQTVSQILTAGVAIAAFSLLLYAFAFNLRESVARAFILILICVVVGYTAESLAGVSDNQAIVEIMLKLKWVGIVFLPATYLHFSDSLLTLTGRPSRGRRRWLVRITYVCSLALVVLVLTNVLVGEYIPTDSPAPYLTRTSFTNIFALYYFFIMIIAGSLLFRAFQRTVTKTSRRRMIYLLTGATIAAIGTYPYLLYGSDFFTQNTILFWALVSLSSLVVGIFLVIMAYSVAFFGVTWPDRLVKSRLFKWLLRGPVTASVALAVTTVIRRLGLLWDQTYNAFVPIFMVGTILFMEYVITLLAPFWERILFYGRDREDVAMIQSLEDHLLTRSDLSQFLEIAAATICDLLQVRGAFIAMVDGKGLELLTTTGDGEAFEAIEASDEVLELSLEKGSSLKTDFFYWNDHLLIPLVYDDPQSGKLVLGLCGFPWEQDREMEEEHLQSLNILIYRVTISLRDWRMQQQVFKSLESLQPQVALIQQLRATSSYNKTSVLLDEVDLPEEDFLTWVKDALSHYWGGPKLTESPLLSLNIVKQAVDEYDGSPANALRAILKTAIEKIKPEGERRFTAEWILYNILELKFLEGRKVREVATRLSMSEADLYRKQRVAIEAVSKAIISMELAAREGEK
ncbi:MAG: histidine kinase N-terminal 7TM domain-containing protein [Chloroflexota bacterium]|nr:histidine kinase N-terminal 7TM domain-containing protein [Chloroflexota bacterium]